MRRRSEEKMRPGYGATHVLQVQHGATGRCGLLLLLYAEILLWSSMAFWWEGANQQKESGICSQKGKQPLGESYP